MRRLFSLEEFEAFSVQFQWEEQNLGNVIASPCRAILPDYSSPVRLPSFLAPCPSVCSVVSLAFKRKNSEIEHADDLVNFLVTLKETSGGMRVSAYKSSY